MIGWRSQGAILARHGDRTVLVQGVQGISTIVNDSRKYRAVVYRRKKKAEKEKAASLDKSGAKTTGKKGQKPEPEEEPEPEDEEASSVAPPSSRE